MIFRDASLAWWFSPKTRSFFVFIVLVTIVVFFLVDMIGLNLTNTAKYQTIMTAIILYFLLVTIVDRMKRKA